MHYVVDVFRHPLEKHFRSVKPPEGVGAPPPRLRKKAMHFELFLLCPQSIVSVKQRVLSSRRGAFTRGSLIGSPHIRLENVPLDTMSGHGNGADSSRRYTSSFILYQCIEKNSSLYKTAMDSFFKLCFMNFSEENYFLLDVKFHVSYYLPELR